MSGAYEPLPTGPDDDGEETVERRASDTRPSLGMTAVIVCIVLMSVWVHSISGGVDKANRHIDVANRHIAAEQADIDAERAKLGTQQQSLVEGCQRLNQVRQSDNTAHLGTYTLFQFVLGAQGSPAEQQAEAAQHLTPAQKALVAEEITHIKSTTAAQSWTPLTNCKQTVAQHGVNYKLPPPISFTTKLPPSSALVVPKAGKHHQTTVRP